MYSSSGDINVIIHEYPNANIERYVEEYKVATQETTPFIPKDIEDPVVKSPTPQPPLQPPLEVISEELEEAEQDEEEVLVSQCSEPIISPQITAEEVKESTSDASTDTSTTNCKRRRWLISRNEVE